MNRIYLDQWLPLVIAFLLPATLNPQALAEDPNDLIERAKLIFSDDFNRAENDENDNWETDGEFYDCSTLSVSSIS
jgi:hypothetical protein